MTAMTTRCGCSQRGWTCAAGGGHRRAPRTCVAMPPAYSWHSNLMVSGSIGLRPERESEKAVAHPPSASPARPARRPLQGRDLNARRGVVRHSHVAGAEALRLEPEPAALPHLSSRVASAHRRVLLAAPVVGSRALGFGAGALLPAARAQGHDGPLDGPIERDESAPSCRVEPSTPSSCARCRRASCSASSKRTV